MKKMMDMMDDAELAKEYPVIAYLKKKAENRTKEEKEKGMENIEKILIGCGFDNLLVLLGRNEFRYIWLNI